jgi:MmeI, DNA-methyltransferase domain/MmeI, helicase spacer domain/MmeI, N-terminal domain/MmeI, target recognition domain
MTAEQFVQKWEGVDLPERAASQEHFIDLCRLIGQPTPAEADPTGKEYCFEKPVKVVGAASKGSKGDSGVVDVWKKGCFAWEYKRKDKYKNLDEAYRQLYQYRDALDNPPLSVVCDIRTFVVRSHFPGYPTEKWVIRLEELPAKLKFFQQIFSKPEDLRPLRTREQTTREIAEVFADVANALIQRHISDDMSLWTSPGDPVAHFLMKVMFCLFAEDVGLLPRNLFTRLIDRCLFEPEKFQPRVAELFTKMKTGGDFGSENIDYFNGGLFDDSPPLALRDSELRTLRRVAEKPWAGVEPTIFGTLFERILDPKKRAQIGAHYTSKEDILLVVDPVVMEPLWLEWGEMKSKLQSDLDKHDAEPSRKKRDVLSAPIKLAIEEFRRRLAKVRVLDPACGSGNFLYVTLQRLLDLEDETVRYCATHDIYVDPVPRVRPTQMHGIEINPYAAELAQVVVWIGHLQWLHEHSITDPHRPILDKLQCIENRDAILDFIPASRTSPSPPIPGEGEGEGSARKRKGSGQSAAGKKIPVPASWPEADFVIGNPPFLGSKLFRKNGLTDDYVNAMYKAFDLPRTSDLCCYWFELGRRFIERHPDTRVGLLATQGIRGEFNREVLERISRAGSLFMAWSDREWILEGANVHVSIIGFDSGIEKIRILDGRSVLAIHADLTSDVDTVSAQLLNENRDLGFMGDTKVGPFEIDWPVAAQLLREPNAAGVSNADVVRPWVNGLDVIRRPRAMWILDFPPGTSVSNAAQFEAVFAYVEAHVRPMRKMARSGDATGVPWWIHQRPRPDMRTGIGKLPRSIVSPNLTKHRVFAFLPFHVLPDHQLIVFARADDYFFGVLHSSIHELWARRMGTQLREVESGFRYTPTTCFETFPLPWIPGQEPSPRPFPGVPKERKRGDKGERELWRRIGDAAKELNGMRERWLNPPDRRGGRESGRTRELFRFARGSASADSPVRDYGRGRRR